MQLREIGRPCVSIWQGYGVSIATLFEVLMSNTMGPTCTTPANVTGFLQDLHVHWSNACLRGLQPLKVGQYHHHMQTPGDCYVQAVYLRAGGKDMPGK